MPPTHVILLILGSVLVLAGIVGGGLSLKELKLPTLTKFSRIFACVFGVIFIIGGIYIEKFPTPKNNEIAEQDRLAEIERQKKEAEFTKRALNAPKNNAWSGEFIIYDPNTNAYLAKGTLIFGPTTYKDKIAYARISFVDSQYTGFKGKVEATAMGWGFMGALTDSSVCIMFGNNQDTPFVVFNKMTKDYENGYLELRGVLFMNKSDGNKVVAHVRSSCRAI